VLDRWASWSIVALVALSFGRVMGNGIAPTDDRATIFMNPRMNNPDHAPELVGDAGLGWYWKHGDLALYVPVTYTIWFVLARLTWIKTPDESGMHLDPHIFHAVSLLLHIGNTLLVYRLLRKLLRFRQVDSAWPALAGALVYGLHPLQVEPVAWTSGMKDLLYCGFSLGAILAYLRAVQPLKTNSDAAWKRWGSYVVGIVLMVAGILCKPTAMVVPLLLLILDRLILRRQIFKVVLGVIPYIIADVPLMIVAKIVQPGIGVPIPVLWQRPIVAGASLAFYLGKLVMPIHMGFDYSLRPIEMVQKPVFWWLACIPLILGIILLLLRNRRLWLLIGALISVTALLPVLGFNAFHFQFFSTVADHYMVLAMLGPAIAVAGLLSTGGGKPKPITVGIMAVILLMLAGKSFRQLRHWRTEEAVLWQMVAVSPDSAMGNNGIGDFAQVRGDLKEAEARFKSTKVNPLYFNGSENLAHLYAREGKPKDAIAAYHDLLVIANRFPVMVRPDYRDMPTKLAMEAIQAGHSRDVLVYMLEIARMWFVKNFESWLGGSSVKYLPTRNTVPVLPAMLPHQS